MPDFRKRIINTPRDPGVLFLKKAGRISGTPSVLFCEEYETLLGVLFIKTSELWWLFV